MEDQKVPFLKVSKTPLEVGDVLRSNGSGNRIMQCLQIIGDDALLISAGRVNAGSHELPNRAHVIKGSIKDHMVLADAGTTIQVYTKVTTREKLPKLMIPQKDLEESYDTANDPAEPTSNYVNQ